MSPLDTPIDRSQYQFPVGSVEHDAAQPAPEFNGAEAAQSLGETARRLALPSHEKSDDELPFEGTPLYYETALEIAAREQGAIREFMRFHESVDAMRQKTLARKQASLGILKRPQEELLADIIEQEARLSEGLLQGVPEGQTHRFYRAHGNALYWTQYMDGSKLPFKVIRYELHPQDPTRMVKVQTQPGREGVLHELVSHDELLLLVHWGNRYEALVAEHVHARSEPRHRRLG